MNAGKLVSLPMLHPIHHIHHHESRFISIVIRRLESSNECDKYIIRRRSITDNFHDHFERMEFS